MYESRLLLVCKYRTVERGDIPYVYILYNYLRKGYPVRPEIMYSKL